MLADGEVDSGNGAKAGETGPGRGVWLRVRRSRSGNSRGVILGRGGLSYVAVMLTALGSPIEYTLTVGRKDNRGVAQPGRALRSGRRKRLLILEEYGGLHPVHYFFGPSCTTIVSLTTLIVSLVVRDNHGRCRAQTKAPEKAHSKA